MPLTQDLVKVVQVEYLMMLSSFLKLGQIDVATARETARTFLTYLPFKTVEDLEAKMKDFIGKYKAFDKLNLSIMKGKEQNKTQEILQKMTSFMKQDNVDAALKVTNKI